MISAIRHFGIYVKNYDESLDFYKKIGFEVFYEKIENWKKDFGILKIAKLKSKDGKVLELIYKNSNDKYLCDSHIAFTVINLNVVYKQLKKMGICFIIKPKLSPDKSVKVAFCLDPNGLKIELVEDL
jgi:catechol 2,3-dioxygenase-like lactoylglutathione lyase family enzyme